MLERMINSTSSFSNIYGFTDDNSNYYRSMMIDEMRMNHDYLVEGSFNISLDEETNIDAFTFF
jgi:hypothetical protein